MDNLEKNVYSFVAHTNNQSVCNIKTNIVKSTKIATKGLDSSPKDIIGDIISELCPNYA